MIVVVDVRRQILVRILVLGFDFGSSGEVNGLIGFMRFVSYGDR